MRTNTHLNHLTRTIQNALQEAEAYLGAEWTIRCVEGALALEAGRLNEHGYYVRAAQFNAASDALAQLTLPKEGNNNG
jgi:hypothetical protein